MKKLLWPIALFFFSHAYALSFQGPLLIDDKYIEQKGTIITGNFQGTMQQPAITVQTRQPITIINSNLEGPADLIILTKGNVSIVNTSGMSSTSLPKSTFLRANQPTNINIENCTITGVANGIVIDGYSGENQNTLHFVNNVFVNIAENAFQLINVSHVANVEIAWNQVINQNKNSNMVSISNSSGTVHDPILIHDNYLQGSVANFPLASNSSYINIFNNQFVNAGNNPVLLTAGFRNYIYNNRIIESENSFAQTNEFSLWQKKLARLQVKVGVQ